MELVRRKPAINIDDVYIANKNGIILAMLVGIISFAATILGVLILSNGIIHWLEVGSRSFGGWILGLLWTLLPAAQTTMSFSVISTGISNIRKRNRWLKQAIHSHVIIIDRKEEHNVYAESREEMWECSLALLRHPSTEEEQDEQVGWLRVSNRIYNIYRNQEVANILYDPSDPNVFIFAGE